MKRERAEMSTVRLTITTSFSDGLFFYELSSDDKLDTLRLLLEGEANVPAADQVIVFNGRALQSGSLAEVGLVGDVSVVLARRQDMQQQQRPGQQRPQQQNQPQLEDPAQLMETIRNDPSFIDQLSRSNPGLLEAALSGNLPRFTQILEETKRQNAEGREIDRREEEYQRLLANADPFDPEAQRKIGEYIRQKNVEENYVNAMEHNPEAFASVSMLYIDCEVNGMKMKAFVDSGAQSTIMSEKCAQACNILHLLDTRFAGVARGVGEAKILGRIHMADLKIGTSHFTSSFTVMQQTEAGKHDLDFLLGLDNLKRHQSCLDLKRIGTEVTPFLAEKDIPGHSENLRSLASSVEGLDISPAPSAPTASANPPSNQPPPVSNNGATEQKIQSVMSVTGASRQEVVEALRACNGNADAAAQMLSGFGF